MFVRRNFLVLILITVLFSMSVSITASAQDAAATCPALVSNALTALGTNCANLDRSASCFGFPEIPHTAFTEAVPDDFYAEPGDRAPLAITETIQTGPLNLEQGVWGLNVMNVNANLPVGLAGKGVVFVQFGGVEVENAVEPDVAVQLPDAATEVTTAAETDLLESPAAPDVVAVLPAGAALSVDALDADGTFARAVFEQSVGWVSTDALDPQVDLSALPALGEGDLTPMQSFYLRTGLGGVSCAEAPSLLFVQAPGGVPTDILVYEQPIRIQSTIIIRQTPDGSALELIVLSGIAILNAGTPDEIIVPPGYIVSIALGPDLLDLGIEGDVDDQGAIGTWSAPRPLTAEELEELAAIEDIPGNLLNYVVRIPQIVGGSSVGGVIPVLMFPISSALDQARALCDAGILPDDVCEYLQLS